MESNEKCPMCHGIELQWAKLIHAWLRPVRWTIFSKNAIIYQLVCTDCGHIVRSKVEYPHHFKSRK